MFLVMPKVPYLVIVLIMIITTKDWTILFVEQSRENFLGEEIWKIYCIYSEVNDTENN